jgi:AraC family transcriptional regulator, transcriptional activator of the genes for pyochelin and ferripyochelin receptors
MMESIGMIRVELDMQDLYKDLAAERIFRSQSLVDRPSNILHDRLTEFRLISDGSFMALVDITVARNYTLRLATKNYVLFVFYVTGGLILPWARGKALPAGSGAAVTVLWDSARPCDYPREAGQTYKRLTVSVDAAKLVDQYGLKVDDLPSDWRDIFFRRPNARAAIPLSLSPRARLALDAMYRCEMDEPLRTHYLRAKSEELICETVFQLNQIGRAGRSAVLARATKEQQLIESAALIFRSELHDQPNIENLARRLGLNRNKLSDGFREMFGTSPGEYARRVRLDWARNQVRERAHSIGAIAAATGYSSLSSFTRAYIQQFGYPPSKEKDNQ